MNDQQATKTPKASDTTLATFAVHQANEKFKAKGLDTDLILRQTAGLPFYNTSLYSLATLGATKTKSNLDAYIAGFSDNARVVFDQFNFTDTIARLARADILFKICQNFANTDLHPDVVPDRVMSNIYEHLIRRFGAEVNEAAEDFMTPRDVVHLATTLLLDPDDALFRNNPGLIRTLYDPTCGTGGFLTDAMNHMDSYTAAGKAPPVLIPFGQELEPETHAVALANMLLRRLETEPARDLSANIAGPKSTLSQDAFAGRHFHYCLSNPPFGKKWEKDQAFVEREAKEKGYDGRFAGARIQAVQDPNVVYDLRGELDKAGIYTPAEVEAFTSVRFKSAVAYAAGERAQHKELYAATSAPTQRFDDQLGRLRAEIQSAEAAFEEAKTQGNEAGKKAADARRSESAEALQKLLDFKSGLARFGTLYTYIAQTIDFGEASLEAFASFARLLSKRLDGVPPDQVDISALLLTGFDIKPQEKPDVGHADEDSLILKPVGTGGGAQAPLPVYLRQVIARLNSIFGEATPLTDKVAFVNHIADIAREDANTVAQVENNPREVAMSGNIKGTVQSAVVRAMQSHSDLAAHVMKNDHLAMAPLVALVYEMIKSGTNIDTSA
jgi:N-6 DNA Methylase